VNLDLDDWQTQAPRLVLVPFHADRGTASCKNLRRQSSIRLAGKRPRKENITVPLLYCSGEWAGPLMPESVMEPEEETASERNDRRPLMERQ